MSPIVFMVQRRRLNFTNLFFNALLKSSNFTKIKYKLEVQGPMSNVLHNTSPRKLHKKLSIIDSFYYISMIITFTPSFCYLTFFRFFFFQGTVVSVLGYCLIPIVGLSGLSVLFSLTGVLGTILTGIAVLWCTASSSKVQNLIL